MAPSQTPHEKDAADSGSVRTLLLVDDEDNVLQALVRLLRPDGYRLLTARRGDEALAILAREPVGAILTDQGMPGMRGDELLAQARERCPEVVRLVMTGARDLDSVLRAVNHGAVYRFLLKPWEDDNLRAQVRDAFQHSDLRRERARLLREIEAANARLTDLNESLARSVAEKSEALQFLANHDPLTELPNRALFRDRLDQALGRAQHAGGRGLALLLLNLNRFKSVNDTFGHATGDQLLREAAQRLRTAARDTDSVARVGPDEFALVLPEMGEPEQAAALAREIAGVFEAPFELAGQEVYVTASLGIALSPHDGAASDPLLRAAASALRHAREQGGMAYRFYAHDMDSRARERLLLESQLRRALEREEFVLHYQPQVNLDGGAIIGVEALLRWRHPQRGLVAPGEFIPVLEECGLIEPVGEWVLQAACRQVRAWQDAGLPLTRMAVNLSARQFRQPRLVERVRAILAEAGVDAGTGCLEIEITESLLMKHADSTLATMDALHAMGVQLAIDDFGTGYSSLSYLRRFPIQSLKIDRSFVQDIGLDPDGGAIVQAIVVLGHSLRLKVIAEGVETGEQLEFLRAIGCDEIQGYLFSRPLPAEDLERLLREQRRLPGCGGQRP